MVAIRTFDLGHSRDFERENEEIECRYQVGRRCEYVIVRDEESETCWIPTCPLFKSLA
jgi:hypothetical protein